MVKSPNERYIAVTRWTEETVTDMPTSISDKQFIFEKSKKITVYFSIFQE